MSYRDISKYRSVWMSAAIILVVIFHSGLSFSSAFMRGIQFFGYGGVDIFLFASGLGCFHSLAAEPDVGRFISKRAASIMPTYLCFIPFWLAYRLLRGSIGATAVIGNIFCIQFFINNAEAFNWYLSMLWLLYFLAPFLFKLAHWADTPLKAIGAAALLGLATVPFWGSESYIIAAARLPVFFVGMVFARLGSAAEKLSRGQLAQLFSLSLLGMAALLFCKLFLGGLLWSYGLLWYPFTLIVPGLCSAMSALALWLSRFGPGRFLLGLMNTVGSCTLEIYLVHCFMFEALRDFLAQRSLPIGGNGLWLLVCLLIIPSAAALKALTRAVKALHSPKAAAERH